MANPQAQAFDDLRNTVTVCLRVVRLRWRLAVIGLTAVSSIAFWGSRSLPREYSAGTLFERRDDAVLQNLIQSSSPYSFSHLKTTLTHDMTGSRALAKGAVKVGLLPAEAVTGEGALNESERSALDAALGRYELRPSVSLVQNSASLDTILLQCAANDPAVARAFVVALRDNYIVETRERMHVILNSTRDFFRSELTRLQDEVAATETGLRQDFDEFPGLDPADLNNVGNRLESLRTERGSVQQRKAELEAQIAARERFLVSASEFYIDAGGVATTQPGGAEAAALHPADSLLEEGIKAVKAQIVQMVTARRMTMEHPEVKRLVGRMEGLEELRRTLAEALPEVPASPASQPVLVRGATNREWQTQQMRIELELDALRRQLAITTEQWEEVDARTVKLGGLYERLMQNGDELRKLREARIGRTSEINLWQTHLASLERVLTAESGERGTQFSLIEEPKDGSLPTKPRVSAVFMVCLGAGLAAAALAVALAELFDRSFRSASQVARTLGIPVLECVGVIATPQVRRRARLARLVWMPTLGVLVFVLAVSAGLAYASLARPDLYQRTVRGAERVLNVIGIAGAAAPGDRAT